MNKQIVKKNLLIGEHSYQRYQDYIIFNTPDARFVYIRLISDAQIKRFIKPNKYKVEEH